MDFVGVLEHVPPLLDACVCDEASAVRTLRLLSKAGSRVALLGLRSYTLTLKCFEGYRNVSGASLLKHSQLQDLSVHLLLSGSFSPAILLRAFMQEVGSSLSTLTSLALHLEDTGGSTVTAAMLDDTMTTLVRACSALTSFTFEGHLATSILRVLGETCPQLTALTYVVPNTVDQVYMQQLLQLQPTLLPHISSLTFSDCDEDFNNLPDMTGNTSITSLHLQRFIFTTQAEWLLLPPKLRRLTCFSTREGPPASTDSSILLGSLLTLELDQHPPTLPLNMFVQLLRQAPAFEGFKQGPGSDKPSCIIECTVCLPRDEETADLAYLNSKMKLPAIRNAKYRLDISSYSLDESLLPAIASLPEMTGVTLLELYYPHAEVGLLLKLYPNVTELVLINGQLMNDVDLQELSVCANLTSLRLEYCDKVTPMGLFALCQRLPLVVDVICNRCRLLEGDALEGCVQLLRQHGSLARLVYKED